MESSSDSARIVRPREDLERPHNREHSSTGAAGQSHSLEIPSRSRKRGGKKDDDYIPHKRKKEDGNEAEDRRIYSSKRGARYGYFYLPSRIGAGRVCVLNIIICGCDSNL